MGACPHDGSELMAERGLESAGRYCRECNGLWLRGEIVTGRLGNVGRPHFLQGNEVARLLPCPDDGNMLLAVHHHKVEVDICGQCCGVWLDRGELEKILMARRDVAYQGPGNTQYNAEMAVEVAANSPYVVQAILEFISS